MRLRRPSPCPRLLFAPIAALAALATAGPAAAQDDWGGGSWGEAEDAGGFLEGDGEGEGEEYVQPPATAGGLYTKETYPIAELERPLTLTEGILEARFGLDVDMSAKGAFEVWRGRIDARYGLRDHVELQAGFDGLITGELASDAVDRGANQAQIDLAVESALAYDLVDVRVGAEIPIQPEAAFDLAFGFPVRWRPSPKLAVIAVDKLMTIHTDGRKPDLTVGVGVIYQIIPKLAALVRGEVTLFEFDTERDPQVPATAALQLSPARKLDLGLEFTFGNVANGDGPLDDRFLLLYAQTRL